MSGQPTRKHPAAWVPTLYFAEGLPFYAVTFMALAPEHPLVDKLMTAERRADVAAYIEQTTDRKSVV